MQKTPKAATAVVEREDDIAVLNQILPEKPLVAAWIPAPRSPHPLNAPFSLDRFVTGALVDEHGAAAVAH